MFNKTIQNTEIKDSCFDLPHSEWMWAGNCIKCSLPFLVKANWPDRLEDIQIKIFCKCLDKNKNQLKD